MSDIRHQKSERVKPHYAQALRALYRISHFRPLLSLGEHGPDSLRGLCRAVAPKAFGGARAGLCAIENVSGCGCHTASITATSASSAENEIQRLTGIGFASRADRAR